MTSSRLENNAAKKGTPMRANEFLGVSLHAFRYYFVILSSICWPIIVVYGTIYIHHVNHLRGQRDNVSLMPLSTVTLASFTTAVNPPSSVSTLFAHPHPGEIGSALCNCGNNQSEQTYCWACFVGAKSLRPLLVVHAARRLYC